MSLADAVSTWRVQESIQLSFYTLYVYYYVTTIDEEVDVVHSQRWKLGKALFVILRYLALVVILLDLLKNYRTYLTFPPSGCKVLLVMFQFLRRIVALAADVSVGLTLCALLGAKRWHFYIIMVISIVPSLISLGFNVAGFIQVPASPIGRLDRELGYPCYLVGDEDFKATPASQGSQARSWVAFGKTIFMMGLAIATFWVRYRDQKGTLVKVIRRDGGLYYLAAAVTKLLSAILETPQVAATKHIMDSPAYTVVISLDMVVPIMVQRLLLNIGQADVLGQRSVASDLLFVTPDTMTSTFGDDHFELSKRTESTNDEGLTQKLESA